VAGGLDPCSPRKEVVLKVKVEVELKVGLKVEVEASAARFFMTRGHGHYKLLFMSGCGY